MAPKKKTEEKPLTQEDAIALALSAVNKKHGAGTILMGNKDQLPTIERIPTGSSSLDIATGGGYPLGRLIELYGPPSSGKSTLSLHAICEAQKQELLCAYVDAEHTFDTIYAEAIGVDMAKLIFSQPDCGEQALDVVETLARSGAVRVIVVDSVAALIPKAELDADMGENKMGLHARLMSQAMRKLTPVAAQHHVLIMFINQLRQKIGVMYGNPETTTGGEALKFYASMRLDIRRKETLSLGNEKTGIRSAVKLVKNKTASAYKVAEINILFGTGIDWAQDLFDVCVARDVILRKGAWCFLDEQSIGQGAADTIETIRNDKTLEQTLRARLAALGTTPAEVKQELPVDAVEEN